MSRLATGLLAFCIELPVTTFSEEEYTMRKKRTALDWARVALVRRRVRGSASASS